MTGKFYGALTQLVICPEFLKAYTHYPGKTMGLSALGSYRQELYEQIRSRTDLLSRYTDEASRNFQASGADVLYLNGERLEAGRGRFV